ncbi:hypothetical protein PLICRDRAFT_464723 [Plicaturopsis crispa FD-325 SS-3]|nr:hypothetical protein PLICRDRAFT_464723 [Plicaturopsis crispa FD-325 SS-3]
MNPSCRVQCPCSKKAADSEKTPEPASAQARHSSTPTTIGSTVQTVYRGRASPPAIPGPSISMTAATGTNRTEQTIVDRGRATLASSGDRSIPSHRPRRSTSRNSLSQSSLDEGDLFDLDSDKFVTLEEPEDIVHNIRRCRLVVMNWQCGWGGDNSFWEKYFSELLEEARQRDHDGNSPGLVDFFKCFEAHIDKGKDILEDLKGVAEYACNSTPDEIRDLFFQGFEMGMAVTSEVKFFEMKLHQYAPAIPLSQVTDYRSYGSRY